MKREETEIEHRVSARRQDRWVRSQHVPVRAQGTVVRVIVASED
jgi:hypothetical protein